MMKMKISTTLSDMIVNAIQRAFVAEYTLELAEAEGQDETLIDDFYQICREENDKVDIAFEDEGIFDYEIEFKLGEGYTIVTLEDGEEIMIQC